MGGIPLGARTGEVADGYLVRSRREIVLGMTSVIVRRRVVILRKANRLKWRVGARCAEWRVGRFAGAGYGYGQFLVSLGRVGDAAGIGEQTASDDAKEESGDVGQVGYAAGADLGNRAKVEELHEKPEADEEGRGNERDAEKDEEEEHSADAVARERS